jgi:hypothetical protein
MQERDVTKLTENYRRRALFPVIATKRWQWRGFFLANREQFFRIDA